MTQRELADKIASYLMFAMIVGAILLGIFTGK